MGDSSTERWERQSRRRRLVRETAEVGRAIATDVHQRFPERQWVRGAVADARFEDDEASFVLTSHRPDGTVSSRLPVVLGDWALGQARRALDAAGLRLEHVIAERQPLVVAGRLAYRLDDNRLELRMDAIDLEATAELLAEATADTRGALQEEGVYERQRGLVEPAAPVRVGVVGQDGSAALDDVRRALTDGEFRVRHEVYTPLTEGNGAAAALADSITRAARANDFVLVVRDPGPRALLTPFDTESVARAVAVAGVPVVTALGSGDEPTLADEVAYRACASPAEAVDVVIRLLREQLRDLERREAWLRKSAYGALKKARAAHDAVAEELEQTKVVAGERVKAARARVRNGILLVVAAAVVVIVGLYVAASPPPWVPAAVGALAVLAGLVIAWPLLRGRVRKGREPGVETEGMTFAQALTALEELREQLEESSQPEEIERLMFEADEISRYCRSLLGNAGEAIAAHEGS